MKKTQRKLKLDTQTVTKLDDNALTAAQGGSGTYDCYTRRTCLGLGGVKAG